MPSRPPADESDVKPKTEVSMRRCFHLYKPISTRTVQADELVEKIYSNMSACHIKQGNWKRALETADKVQPPSFATRGVRTDPEQFCIGPSQEPDELEGAFQKSKGSRRARMV